jgi:hypothetical protein
MGLIQSNLKEPRRRKRRSTRKKNQLKAILHELDCPNSTQMDTIPWVKSKSIKTSEHLLPISRSIEDGSYAASSSALSNAYRTSSTEKKLAEKLAQEDPEQTYESIRKAAEVHRLVRKHARKHIQVGMSLTEAVENIEDGVRALAEGDGMEAGIGFPTGINRNEIAAHYSPNAGDAVGKAFDLFASAVLKRDFQLCSKGTSSKSILVFM